MQMGHYGQIKAISLEVVRLEYYLLGTRKPLSSFVAEQPDTAVLSDQPPTVNKFLQVLSRLATIVPSVCNRNG